MIKLAPLLLLLQAPARADDDLMKLMEAEERVTVATRVSTPIRQTPGIITVVTRDEIQDSGARDIIDVLRLVPGLEFGADVQGVVSLGVRGVWAQEGKVLLLLDGVEMNERLYTNLPLGNRFPVDQIQRIEIIRGPGSVVYGGYAELAVINIVTQSAKELDGGRASFTYGRMEKALGRANTSLSYGKAVDGTELTGKLFFGYGSRSGRRYADSVGESFGLGPVSRTNPAMLNLGAARGGFKARFITERYVMTQRDEYGTNLVAPKFLTFRSFHFAASWEKGVGEHLKLTPSFDYTKQHPWQDVIYDNSVERFRWGLVADYDVTPSLKLIGGPEISNESGYVGDVTFTNGLLTGLANSGFLLEGDRRKVYYLNQAYHGQIISQSGVADLTLGARYEKHSHYDSVFLPRASVMKVLGDFHVKALYSKAFRAPGISNIALSPNWDIQPERTTAVEAEIGWRPSPASSLTLNVFDTTILRPIVYFHDNATNTDQYRNLDRTGTHGAELAFKFRDTWGHAEAGYSFYTTNKNTVDLYKPGDHRRELLGFASHKLTLSGGYKFCGSWTAGPSATYLSRRFGYTGVDPVSGLPILSKFPAVVLANLYVHGKDVGVKGLGVGAGVYNVFDQGYAYIQPYNRGATAVHPPIPGPSREFAAKLSYDF